MSILVHKAGINKSLGQKSDAANTSWRDNLIGEWLPDTAFNTEVDFIDTWTNQQDQTLGQGDLRLFNGLTAVTGPPAYISFDGVSDYIWNTSTGYGGTPFTVDLSADFTIGHWVRCTLSSAYTATMCVQTGANGGSLSSSIGSDGKWTVTGSGGAYTNAATRLSYSLSSNTWFYLSVSHDRSESKCCIYINGKFHNQFTPVYTAGNWDGAYNLGFGHDRRSNSSNINSNSTLRLGKYYVWDKYWGASQHRHVFLGTNDINNGKYYGNDYTA